MVRLVKKREKYLKAKYSSARNSGLISPASRASISPHGILLSTYKSHPYNYIQTTNAQLKKSVAKSIKLREQRGKAAKRIARVKSWDRAYL
jgi:hypothetical protein